MNRSKPRKKENNLKLPAGITLLSARLALKNLIKWLTNAKRFLKLNLTTPKLSLEWRTQLWILSTLIRKLKARLVTFKKLNKVCPKMLQSKLFLTKYKSKIMKLSRKRKNNSKNNRKLLNQHPLKKSYSQGLSWKKTSQLLKKWKRPHLNLSSKCQCHRCRLIKMLQRISKWSIQWETTKSTTWWIWWNRIRLWCASNTRPCTGWSLLMSSLNKWSIT